MTITVVYIQKYFQDTESVISVPHFQGVPFQIEYGNNNNHVESFLPINSTTAGNILVKLCWNLHRRNNFSTPFITQFPYVQNELVPFFQLPSMVWSSTYTGGTPWKFKLVGDVISLIMWRFLKKFLTSKLQDNQLTQLITSYMVQSIQECTK